MMHVYFVLIVVWVVILLTAALAAATRGAFLGLIGHIKRLDRRLRDVENAADELGAGAARLRRLVRSFRLAAGDDDDA